MTRIAELFTRYRAALPLAAFLLFLNTAKDVFGRLELRTALCGLSFWALVQLSYVYDSLFRTKEDAVNLPGTAQGRSRAWPVFAAAALPAGYIAWLGFWPMIAIAFLIIPFYSDPGLSKRRLKEVPVLKNLVSVLHFWLVGVLVPVLLGHDLSVPLFFSVLRSAAPLLYFVFLLTVLLDVRDLRGDAEAGVRTIPVLIGGRTAAAALGALFAAGGWALFHVGRPSEALLPAVLALFSFLALRPRGRAFYEWLLAAVNAFFAARLLMPG